MDVIWVWCEGGIFFDEDWTTQITLESLGKSSSDGIGYPVDDAMDHRIPPERRRGRPEESR